MDKILKDALNKEKERQYNNIELIASENYVSSDILELQGSIFTNKYAEGYSHKRYYGGCENVDIVEDTAVKYVCELFKCKYANVQLHSGSTANMAVYRALLNKGDTVLGMSLDQGGHLTHGYSLSFSGEDYNCYGYGVDPVTNLIDYDNILELAIKYKPKMIIAGASAYSRIIDFEKFRSICDKVGAYLMVDMAHIAGLVATGLHPNPLIYADVVTSTTHKTLRGPRGGIILTNDLDIINRINKVVFPGIQGGPLMHVIAAKAECFYEALQDDFVIYQKQVIKNIKALSDVLISNNIKVISGGTDNHLILVDVNSINLTGKEAESKLSEINITVNKNSIPYDKLSAFVTSGIRIGSPAMTTRGLLEKDFKDIGLIISDCLLDRDNKENLILRVKDIIKRCKF